METANNKFYKTDEDRPFTNNSAVQLSTATLFSAKHVYRPTCSAETGSIVNMLTRLLNLANERLLPLPFSGLANDDDDDDGIIIGRSFLYQDMFIGSSPSAIIHCAVTVWPAWKACSPKENGIILGATGDNMEKKSAQNRRPYIKINALIN